MPPPGTSCSISDKKKPLVSAKDDLNFYMGKNADQTDVWKNWFEKMSWTYPHFPGFGYRFIYMLYIGIFMTLASGAKVAFFKLGPELSITL